MANNGNLIPFSKRSEREAREYGRKGGKASGEARRRKADFRAALNLLLTVEIDSPEWTPLLKSMGLDSTLETAVNMAMIQKALAGDVKAYEAIAKYSGQGAGTDADREEQRARIEQMKAQTSKLSADQGGDDDDGVEIINDAPKETGKDI